MRSNEIQIVFIGGVHGVGKSSFVQKASSHLRIPSFSASELIRQYKRAAADVHKRVQNVEENQDALVAATRTLTVGAGYILLDGHFCVFDADGLVRIVPVDTFRALNVKSVVLLFDDADRIVERLKSRDKRDFDVQSIVALQSAEISHAEYVSKTLDIPLFVTRIKESEEAILFLETQIAENGVCHESST